MKPKLRISFGIRCVTDRDGKFGAPFLMLSATNYGPGQVTCGTATIKVTSLLRRLTRRAKIAVVLQDFRNPLCSKLPHRLNMAEETNLIFPYDANCFLHVHPTHVGISDSFGRVHWAPRGDVKRTVTKYDEEFPTGPTDPGVEFID
jgi:hypothetical protein